MSTQAAAKPPNVTYRERELPRREQEAGLHSR